MAYLQVAYESYLFNYQKKNNYLFSNLIPIHDLPDTYI